MNVASAFQQLAHLVRVNVEDARSIENLSQEACEQMRALMDHALVMALELETLAASVTILLIGVVPNP